MNDIEKHIYFMNEAIQQAKLALMINEVPVGAVIVFDGKVIASGFNKRESNHDPLGHAEIYAIKEASALLGTWRLNGCQLYCTLEPCLMCAGAIVLSRLDSVIFASKDPKAGAFGSIANILDIKGLNHYPNVIAGVCQPEASELLSDFFRNLRKSG